MWKSYSMGLMLKHPQPQTTETKKDHIRRVKGRLHSDCIASLSPAGIVPHQQSPFGLWFTKWEWDSPRWTSTPPRIVDNCWESHSGLTLVETSEESVGFDHCESDCDREEGRTYKQHVLRYWQTVPTCSGTQAEMPTTGFAHQQSPDAGSIWAGKSGQFWIWDSK